MMHASGNVRQSKQRFWNRISNMFDSITSEEPQILRAQNSGALDVFEQPKTGHLSNVTGMRPSSSKPKQQTSIPKPNRVRPLAGRLTTLSLVALKPPHVQLRIQAQHL